MLDESLEGRQVVLTPSMVKFKTPYRKKILEINKFFEGTREWAPAKLNRQVILALAMRTPDYPECERILIELTCYILLPNAKSFYTT